MSVYIEKTGRERKVNYEIGENTARQSNQLGRQRTDMTRRRKKEHLVPSACFFVVKQFTALIKNDQKNFFFLIPTNAEKSSFFCVLSGGPSKWIQFEVFPLEDFQKKIILFQSDAPLSNYSI